MSAASRRNRKKKMQKFSAALQEIFSTREIWHLLDYLIERKLLPPPLKTNVACDATTQQMVIESLGNSVLYAALSRVVLGRVLEAADWQEVVKELGRARSFIKNRHWPTWVIRPTAIPSEERVFINNRLVSKPVLVSGHAWERWLERYSRVYPQRVSKSSEKMEVLKRLFAEAGMENIPLSRIIHRLASNKFEEAIYLKHKQAGVRFVVSKDEDRLLTVEIAVRGGN